VEYFITRLRERDTQTVVLAAVYQLVKTFAPVSYYALIDSVAAAIGAFIAATPNK
jgi:hypothetical protein